MSTEVRWRRGTGTQHEAFVGAMSEVTHETTNNNLRVHDGQKPGGYRTLMEQELGVANGIATLDDQGNVPLSQLGNAVSLGRFWSRSDLRHSSVPPVVTHARVLGYDEAGDCKPMTFKRSDTPPSHPGYEQSEDGSYWIMSLIDGVEVRQFGAKGTGNGDDTIAIQNAYDALNTVGGVLRIRRGRYPVSNLSFIQTATDWHSNRRVSILGDGSGLVTLRYIGASGNDVVTWDTNLDVNTDGTGGNSWAKIGGFCIEGANLARSGLHVVGKSWFMMDDIRIIQCVTHSFKIDGTLSWSGRALRAYDGQYGFRIEKSDDPRGFSMPNNVNLYDVTVGNATVYGMHVRNPGSINIYGGSFESNGTHGNVNSGGLYVVRNDIGIGIEGVALNLKTVYFEKNKGKADITIDQQSSTKKMTNNIDGCIFNRLVSTGYTTNNIYLLAQGAATMALHMAGNSFSHDGDYIPSASERCIALAGDAIKITVSIDPTNVFLSTVNDWSDLNGPWVLPSGSEFASARVQASGAVSRKKNISSITKTGVGVYRIIFNYPARSAAPQLIGSLVGSVGSLSVTAESATEVSVTTYGASGTPADNAFSFTVNDY